MIKLGTNLQGEIKKDNLILKINMKKKGKPSASGKSQVIAKVEKRVQFLDELGKEYSDYGLIVNLFKVKKSKK